ncbi:MAG: urease accessory protein UreD [Ferruginibacter sp.]
MISRLNIQAAVKADRTYLKNVFFTTPFKIANITENRKARQLKLMLMSSSPGILDGDQYQIKIDLDTGSSVQLLTQSYQRLFNMKESATQSMEVNMAAGSSFFYLPHPAVPHKQSSFSATNKIYLATRCSLILGEILTCGRKLNGEVFLFSKYHSITEIYLENKLVVKENLLIQPALTNVNAIGQLEGFTHQASLIYLDEQALDVELSKSLQGFLGGQNNIMFGITKAPVKGLIIRLLGQKAEQLYDCLVKMGEMINTGKTIQTNLV